MLKFFTRSIPIVVQFVFFGFGLIFAAQIAALGGSGWQVNLPSIAGGVVSPIAAFLVGKIITPKRVAPLIGLGGTLIALTAIGIFFCKTFWWLVVWSITVNVAVCFYSVPIQLLIQRIQGDTTHHIGRLQTASFYVFGTRVYRFFRKQQPLVYTVSFYLVGVSIGQGLGILLCGHIPHDLFSLIGAILGIFIVVLMVLANRAYPPVAEVPVPKNEKVAATSGEKIPRFVIAGWILVGMISLSLSMMTPAVTFRGSVLGISEAVRANVLSSRSLTEGIVVLLLILSKRWMNFRYVPAGLAVLFTISLFTFAFGTTANYFYAASILFGIGLGLGLFYMTYHALCASGSNGKYAIGTEIVIGVTQFLGPVCGATATPTRSGLPFLIAAVVAVGETFFLIYFLCGKSAKEPRVI